MSFFLDGALDSPGEGAASHTMKIDDHLVLPAPSDCSPYTLIGLGKGVNFWASALWSEEDWEGSFHYAETQVPKPPFSVSYLSGPLGPTFGIFQSSTSQLRGTIWMLWLLTPQGIQVSSLERSGVGTGV